MKNFLYPLIAAAMITIAPFLLTFEEGQDIVRGLLDYCILALLFLFVYIKKIKKARLKCFLLFFVGLSLFACSVIDLLNILAYKGWSIGWRIFIPMISCIISLLMLKSVKPLSLNQIFVFLFLLLVSHFYLSRIILEQPFLEFPLAQWLSRTAPDPDLARNDMTPEFREKNNAVDSVSVTRYHLDSTRSNVVVLVESWGIPMDSALFEKELAVFDGLLRDYGVHFRMYSRTRTAEREDLLDSAWQDSARRRDSLFIPKRFATLGHKTSFLFGGDSTIQRRYKYIRNIGFQEVFWTDLTTADIAMASKIDSLLNTSVCDSIMGYACLDRRFIAWTTRDTRFPISDDAVETEKLYYERMFSSLKIIADLARKHTNVRFVVQGDHEPILSPLEFQRKFYRRWVPFVVLN